MTPWYKDAVFYEIPVKSFCDSNGDGIGDFVGLTGKLDFLRNHDELTLEMVTEEERGYLLKEYAHAPRMKLNLGIRRRLAPLMDFGRRQIELLVSLIMSMPGSPVLYYGDEIGMDNNIYRWAGHLISEAIGVRLKEAAEA